jgi:hypothetical protein
MSNQRKIELCKAIAAINNEYPPDDLITTYADYLKVRNTLPYYQFNPRVFEQLVQLTISNWKTHKRINRIGLLTSIKLYSFTAPQNPHKSLLGYSIPCDDLNNPNTALILFTLFQLVYNEAQYISPKQLRDARKICNRLLIDITLTQDAETWLCNHAFVSTAILNRVLRYPQKSTIISAWAQAHFNDSTLCARRAELIGWILDIDPGFVVSKEILIKDFEYMNAIDQKAISDYEDELRANKLIEDELSDFLPRTRHYDPFEGTEEEEAILPSVGELKLSKRFYGVSSIHSESCSQLIPNFERMKEEFNRDIDMILQITMIWSIGYSRLNHQEKTYLLKSYYNEERYRSIYKVGLKNRNTELLHWLIEMQSRKTKSS